MITKLTTTLRIGTGLGLSLGIMHGVVPAVDAAALSPTIQAARALMAATSYRQFSVIHTTTAGSTTGSSVTLTLDLVRRGTHVRIHYLENVDGTIIELVQTGLHACERSPQVSPTWSCGPGNTKNYESFAYAEKSMGVAVPYRASGTQMRMGQLCNLYTATVTAPAQGAGHVTFWFAISGGRPVEQDGAFTRGTSKTIWSNWNDPRLVIPAVPVS